MWALDRTKQRPVLKLILNWTRTNNNLFLVYLSEFLFRFITIPIQYNIYNISMRNPIIRLSVILQLNSNNNYWIEFRIYFDCSIQSSWKRFSKLNSCFVLYTYALVTRLSRHLHCKVPLDRNQFMAFKKNCDL